MVTADGKKSIIITTLLTPLSTVFLSLRLMRKRQMLGIDDWLLCFAVLMTWLLAVGSILMAIKGGEGKQMNDLSPSELTWLLKLMFWPELAYTICIATIKISVLISYNLIFGRLKWFRYATFVLGIITSMWFVGVFFAVLFQCTPIDKTWRPMKPGHCISIKPFFWGNSISNAILDYLILLLPVVPVWNLQMSKVQKVLVLLSFSLGSLASASSTVRAVQTDTLDAANISATLFKDAIWTYIEPNAGVLGACLPYLANVFRHKIVDALKSVWKAAQRSTSFLRLRSRTESDEDNTEGGKIGTQRARYESYDMGMDNERGVTAYKNSGASQESVRHLV
ncbi:MAG: hypothetical protein Q9181_004047 [Wetmoreana brouardii]